MWFSRSVRLQWKSYLSVFFSLHVANVDISVKNVDPVCEKHETDGAHFAKDGAQQGEKEVDAKKQVEKDKKACVGVVFWNPFGFML